MTSRVLVKPGLGYLGHWQTMQSQIRRLMRVYTVCLNYRKLRFNETVLNPRSVQFSQPPLRDNRPTSVVSDLILFSDLIIYIKCILGPSSVAVPVLLSLVLLYYRFVSFKSVVPFRNIVHIGNCHADANTKQFTTLILCWPWKRGQCHQNLISRACHAWKFE